MRIVERHSMSMRIYLARGGWALLVPLRHALAFAHGIARHLGPPPSRTPPRRDPGLPIVVSVGNIVAGGTGKTPCVLAIAAELSSRGFRPVVASSGYGGTARRAAEPLVVRPTDRMGGAAGVIGDEAAIYLQEGYPVVVCRDRAKAIEAAARELGPTHVILDDAFHCTGVAKDLDILLLDHAEPFAGGRLLPAGPLREPPASARRADAIVFTRASDATIPEAAARVAGSIPAFFARHQPAGLYGRHGRALELSSLSGRPVVLFSGIARHDSFEELARSAGLDPAVSVRFDDHHRYRSEDAEFVLSQEGPGAALVTTAKDWEKALAVFPGDAEMVRLEMRVEIDGIGRLLGPVL